METQVDLKKLSIDDLVVEAEQKLAPKFQEVDAISMINQERILKAFRDHRVSEEFFAEKTGYGLNDAGREAIDAIYADAFQTEAAAIRMQFVSGTHAIACALLGNLKPGDRLLTLSGAPYDTLEEVIGITGDAQGSLQSLGIAYEEGNVLPFIHTDSSLENELEILLETPTTMVHIQKSCGYSFERITLSNREIGKLVDRVHKIRPECIVFVDNCYGEFVEAAEPTALGADLIAGSLIKNPGGGLAITGGYIAGKQKLVDNALNRLTAPGIGGHLGLSFNQNRHILQGLFLAPSVVSQAVKGALLAAYLFEKLGLPVQPGPFDSRFDIIQAIKFGYQDGLINFCRALQRFSPVDAHVVPEPALLPGYEHEVVMAGGTFVSGSTIEFSADGPLRPPFAAYLQGGLSYLHVKCALKGALELAQSGELPFLSAAINK